MIYGKSELLKKLSDIARKGWSNTHIRDLIDTLWREPNSMRTAGFYYAGGNESVIDLIPGFDEGEGSGSGDDVYSLTFTIDPEEKKYTFYQRRGLLTYHRKFETELATVPCTEGLHYIYFDFDPVSKEEILYVTSPPYVNVPTFEFLMVHRCMVASVYYDAEKMEAIVFNDMRYGSEWNPQMHKTIRNTLGSLRDFGLAFKDLTADDEGDEDIHAQFGISAGAVWHGDIYKTSAGVARGTGIPIMYFNTADNPRIIENPGWAVKFGSLLQYQNAGEMTDAQDEYFVLYHIFATNCLYNEFISVPGIAEYEKLADAGLAMLSELEDIKELLPYTDFLHIGTLIFQTSAAFTNAAHSRIVSYSFTVFTEMSVQGNGNPSDKIKLVNDQETPEAGTFYGAHYETAEKGFHGIDPRLMGSGQAIFLHSNDSDVSGYKQALPVTPDEAMATYTVAADSSLGEVLLKAFVTDAGYPGVTVIPAGAWIFDLWLAITGGSASSVVVRVYKQDPSGTEMELFYFEQPVTDNVGSQHIRAVAQNMIEIADDDRLAIKLFHKNEALTSRTMYLFVEGDTLAEYKWSNVRIPLEKTVTGIHNNLDGLQGGNSTERYHHSQLEIYDHVYEAPEDGKVYGRMNGAWVEIADDYEGSGSGSGSGSGGGGVIAEVVTDLSVTGNGTAEDPITLVGDAATPGNSKYYGTNGAGAKGYHNLPAGLEIGDWIEDISFDFGDVDCSSKTYVLDIKASFSYNILSAVLQSDSTMSDVAIKINGTAIGGLNAIDVTTAINDINATSGYSVAIGDSVTLVTSVETVGDPTYLRGKLRIQRT